MRASVAPGTAQAGAPGPWFRTDGLGQLAEPAGPRTRDPEPGRFLRADRLGDGADLLQQGRQVEVMVRFEDVFPFDLEHLGSFEGDPSI